MCSKSVLKQRLKLVIDVIVPLSKKNWALPVSLWNWVLGVLHHDPRWQSGLYFFHTSHGSCPIGGGGV